MMDIVTFQLLHLVAPVVALATMCLVHAVWCRLVPNVPMLNALAGSGVAGLIGLASIEAGIFLAGQPWGSVALTAVLIDAPIYACLSYGYANFVNLGQSSVRVRIYRELLATGAAGVAMATLRGQYDEGAMLRARLTRLVEAGDLTEQNGTYRVGRGRLLNIAACVFTLKHLVLGRRSEFSS